MTTLLNHWKITVSADVLLRIGYYPAEKNAPQSVQVAVTVFCPLASIDNPHELSGVVNYDVLHDAILGLCKDDHVEGLESVILRLMREVFSLPQVSSAIVEMTKPHAYAGASVPTVSLSLSRDEWNTRFSS